MSLPCFRVLGSPGEEPLWVWLEACWGLKGEAGPHFVDPDTWHTRSKPFRLPVGSGWRGSGQRASFPGEFSCWLGWQVRGAAHR